MKRNVYLLASMILGFVLINGCSEEGDPVTPSTPEVKVGKTETAPTCTDSSCAHGKNEPEVKFRVVAGMFIADFYRPSFLESTKNSTGKTTGKTTGKAGDLLLFLKGQPEATIREMATRLELTEDGVNYHLKKLQQAGKLKRIGGRKTGHWKVESNSSLPFRKF